MDLTFRQLQTFVEVMRAGSISEAGRSLGRTQPAVSAMLAGLEREIGFSLFEREKRRLIAKPEAHYFLEEAEIVLSRLSQSARTLREIGNLEKGKLRIACNPAASGFFMPRVLSAFLKDKPGVNASLMMRTSPIVTDWIASQQYDIGFAETPEQRQTIQMETFRLNCVCAMRASDPLASLSVITPNNLDGKPLAMLFDEHISQQQTVKAFSDAGAKINRRFELRTFLPALQLVSEGLCYSICDGITANSYKIVEGEKNSVVFRPFKPDIYLDMSLMMPANRPASMLAEEFAKVLRLEAQQLLTESAAKRPQMENKRSQLDI